MSIRTRAFAAILCIQTLAPLGAAADGPAVDSSSIAWQAAPGYRLTLTVSGAGQVERHEFEAGEAPVLMPYDRDGSPLSDGSYTWQLVAAPQLSRHQQQALAEARRRGEEPGGEPAAAGYSRSGSFAVSGGLFVVGEDLAGDRDGGSFTKDNVIRDDLVVTGSACIGFGCVDGESFGLDTVRLKENVLRLKFEDDSTLAGFPTNDWEITINDPSPGGRDRFTLRDVDAGEDPFTIEAGAGANAVYVDDLGNVGLGTATPAADLQILRGDSPGLRLEQDASAGFVAQTWDVAGNEAHFFVRDFTHGTLPLRIEPRAPRDSLFIAASGSVALGNASPRGAFHVENTPGGDADDFVIDGAGRLGLGTTAPLTDIHIENSDSNTASIRMAANNGRAWYAGLTSSVDGFNLNALSNPGTELSLDATGNLTILGQIITGGALCGGGCDRVFQPDYDLETIEEHAASMWRLGYLPAVGPTVENGKAWNLTAKTGGLLNELEKAHIYIEQLSRELRQREARIDDLSERVARLEAAKPR